MKNGAITHTLLEAQDFHLDADFRDPTARRRAATPPARAEPHDFLVLCAHPDLMPENFPAVADRDYNCERNRPLK